MQTANLKTGLDLKMNYCSLSNCTYFFFVQQRRHFPSFALVPRTYRFLDGHKQRSYVADSPDTKQILKDLLQ